MIESLAKATMLSLFALATPVDQSSPELWANWGLAGVVIAYVLWRDWQRERRLGAAIESQQRWIRDTLVHALERNAAAVERMAGWMEGDPPEPGGRTRAVRTLRALDAGDGRSDSRTDGRGDSRASGRDQG